MVTLILTRIVFVLSIPLCLYAVYFGVVALFGLRKKLPAAPQAKPEKRFALVVAARNEAAVIGHLVDSLYGQDYPRELYEVIVAPNNCTDDTEAVAAGRGARIFRPEGVIRSKGEVLTQVVDKIVLAEEFDAMCVFDADNLVDGQFLARMNDALVSGAQVAQGFRDSKNPEQSAISGCYSICYWMLNRFYNGARSALHLSALVNGSGFAVTTALLRRLGGWHTVTMTEDYEFSAQCAMLGERVHFVPEALIYDEQPLTFRQSWKQRPPLDDRQPAGAAELRPRPVQQLCTARQLDLPGHVPHVSRADGAACQRSAGDRGAGAHAVGQRHHLRRHYAARHDAGGADDGRRLCGKRGGFGGIRRVHRGAEE